MKRKVVWLILSCLIVVALVLTSCGPAAEEGEGKTVVGKVVEKEAPEVEKEEEVVKPEEKGPQHGGTLVLLTGWAVEPDKWDPIEYSSAQESAFTGYYLENLLTGDLSKGARGTKEYWFNDTYWVPDQYITGQLAESWEFTDPLTVRFHLRPGVYFQDKPGVMTSREMTSADVVFSLNRLIEAKATLGTRYEWMESVSAPDKYTVDLKLSKFSADWLWRMTARGTHIIPPELVQAGVADVKKQVGTGPFMLVDYVKGSALTYDRNPNYWGKTTIDGKEYRLPFIDRLIVPFIAEPSTQLAALRTGKADILANVQWQFRESLKATNPELKEYVMLIGGAGLVCMREDIPPFNDIRVRKAMNMAVDRKAFIDSQLGGEAVLLSWPFSAAWPKVLFTPLEDYPASTQENFAYNPEKAKQLLAEAGYPNGFKIGLIYSSIASATADVCSMLASHWADIGVEVELKPMEQGAFVGVAYGKKYTDMIYYGGSNSSPFSIMRNVGEPGDFYNLTMFNYPDWYAKFTQAKGEREYAGQNKLLKELNAEAVSTADYVILPTGYVYRYAQPWVNNYYGETNSASFNLSQIMAATVWLDLDMKQEMIGKR